MLYLGTQTDLFQEIIVDNFAGGGGASTGIELATGRVVDIAINHDPDAILMHKTNHPYTEHIQASVWDVDPVEVCRGRPVGLAWFSPDCKHFSKAKGAALVDRNIRGHAWIVLRWAGTVRPRVIILENVEEFTSWGPVRKGKPVKKLSGQTFLKWKSQLLDLGYAVEHRELVAADYGAPTIRKRFVLVARCDGKPIVWPERTHAPADSEEVQSGKCKPWRSAAEIIDWRLPMYSIFDSKAEIKEKYGVNAVRPLADNTLRRIIRGADKFTIKSGKPFLVPTGYGERSGQAPRVNNIEKPLNTVIASGKHNLCDPILSPVTFSNTNGSVGFPASKPVHTITSDGKQILQAAQLIQYHTEQTEAVRASGLYGPMQTIDASNRYGLVSANLLGQAPDEPLQTITAQSNPYALCRAVIQRYDTAQDVGRWPQVRALLNKYCGYALAEDEIILLLIGGVAYYIRDILLRMLSPRELYSSMGFPPDYIIDRDYTGNEYGKTKQVARCGNAVCPPMAEAVVRANYEGYAVVIPTMARLLEVVSA